MTEVHVRLDADQQQLQCTVDGCESVLPFISSVIIDHMWRSHRIDTLTRLEVASKLIQIGLSFLNNDGKFVFCTKCAIILPKPTVPSLIYHLHRSHCIRLRTHPTIQYFLDNVTPSPSTNALRQPQILLALHCPKDDCSYAISVVNQDRLQVNESLLSHIKKCHGSAAFDGSMSLVERARNAKIGDAVYAGKRLKKTEIIDIQTCLTSTTKLHVADEIESGIKFSSQEGVNSLTSEDGDSSLPTSTSPSTSSSQQTSQTIYSATSFTRHPHRDDFYDELLKSKRQSFECSISDQASDLHKLSESAISLANSGTDIYLKLNWWVAVEWYTTICTEGALKWFQLLNTNATESASNDTLFWACLKLIEYGIHCAEQGKMLNPGIAGSLSSGTDHDIEDIDDESSAMCAKGGGARYAMSSVTVNTQERYAKRMVGVLRFINNMAHMETGVFLFGNDWNTNEQESNAGLLVQHLLNIEWPKKVERTNRMGIIAQAVAATALVDGRPSLAGGIANSDQLSSVLVTDIILTRGSELASTCSAAMYVMKCLIVINRLQANPFVPIPLVSFNGSRSGPQLAALKSDYDNSPNTQKQPFDDIVNIDVEETFKRGHTPVIRLCTTNGGGVYYFGKQEISSAVTNGTSISLSLIEKLLVLMKAPPSLVVVLSTAERNVIFFPQQKSIAHFRLTNEAESTIQLNSGTGSSDSMSVQDIGEYISASARQYLESHPHSRKEFETILRELQDFVLFLVHVVSGGPGRAQDLLDIMLFKTPSAGFINAFTDTNLRIDAIVHKMPSVQHGSTRYVSRFPNYHTSRILAVFVSLSIGAYPDQRRLWNATIREEADIIKCFERSALRCFRAPLNFNWWRHIAQLLISHGSRELNSFAQQIQILGSQSLSEIENESLNSAQHPSVVNILTQQLGHTVLTAALNYGTKNKSQTDWQVASWSYQRFLQIENTKIDLSQREASVKDINYCIFPDDAADSCSREQYIGALLSTVYPGSVSARSSLQLKFLFEILDGSTDVIITGGCGTGKSAAYLVPALALNNSNSGRCILLLCPQKNVALSAASMCRVANLDYICFGDSNQNPQQFVNSLCETQGRSLSTSIVIATFQEVSDSPLFNDFLGIMFKTNRLVRVIVDEVHICLSSFSWRNCFSQCGNLRARIGYGVPWVFTTATLPISAIGPYKRFWSCGLRRVAQIRTPTELAPNIYIKVQSFSMPIQGYKELKNILMKLFDQSLASDWHARRCLVLVPSVKLASELTTRLNNDKMSLNLLDKDSIQSVTGETSTGEVISAIEHAKVIVCTTVISSSMNINNLDAVIVFKTTYSLADLIQAWGRAGRDGQPARGILLWCKTSHTSLFPEGSLDADLSSLGWTLPKERTKDIRIALCPSGVLAFAEETGVCRRLQLFRAFDGNISTPPATCAELISTLSNSYCDNCVSELLFASNADAVVKEETIKHVPLLESVSPNTTHEETLSSQDEYIEDPQDMMAFLSQSKADDPAAVEVQFIFGEIARLLRVREQAALLNACFMCNKLDCAGIRDSAKTCSGRDRISVAVWGYICYGCGGNHSGKDCKFRSTKDLPPVPPNIQRCFYCYLPQHAVHSSSFHPGDGNLSGTAEYCMKRGKCIFGLLTAAAHLRFTLLEILQKEHGWQLSSKPPFPIATRDDGTQFALFWAWLWEFSPLQHSTRNIDVLVHFLLRILALDK